MADAFYDVYNIYYDLHLNCEVEIIYVHLIPNTYH